MNFDNYSDENRKSKQLDDKLKLHSCLVPYNQLQEEEKKYDRDTLLESLKVLTKLVYKIEKK